MSWIRKWTYRLWQFIRDWLSAVAVETEGTVTFCDVLVTVVVRTGPEGRPKMIPATFTIPQDDWMALEEQIYEAFHDVEDWWIEEVLGCYDVERGVFEEYFG